MKLNILLTPLLACFITACNSEIQNIRFGAGNKGGFYDKFANSLAEQFNQKNDVAKIQVKTTAGSAANIRLMEEGFLDLGIVQGDILQDHLMKSRSRTPISAVASLYTESIQIVVAANSEIKSINDLQNHRVSVGEEESGVYRNAEIILEAYGIPENKIQRVNLNFKDAATALKAGQIDAFFCTAGIPTPSISELANGTGVRILSLDSLDASRIQSLHPELTLNEIPAGTYAGQDSAVQTLGTKAILVASLLLDDTTVKKIAEGLSTSPASTQIPFSFHPGAAAFYATKGVNVEKAAPLQGRGPIPSTGD